MTSFHGAYQKLNKEQKHAVDTIDGPVMVVAGPGTGKTQILSLRIANILKKTDTPADGILALTFTESGVHSMRKRLLEMIGNTAYKVGIYTFHGFSNDIISRYPDSFPRIIGATQIDDIDRILLLKSLIDDLPVPNLRPLGDPFYHLHAIKNEISTLKRENITPKTLEGIIQRQKSTYESIEDLRHTSGKYAGETKGKYLLLEKAIKKNENLLLIYSTYEAELERRRLFDYEDMILEVIHALEKDTELLLSLQEQYLYFLADEHQDANNAQNRLLELLASFHQSPNLFVVGDAKQAIYRFQGASLENFLYFKKRYPESTIVSLTTNYRSTEPILTAAHNLAKASSMPEDLLVPLTSVKSTTLQSPEILSFNRPEDERVWVAESVLKLIREGVPPEEIAVLYRTNRDADSLVDIFEKNDVPHVVESDQNILRDPSIRKFISLLKAVAGIGNDLAVIKALHADFLDIPQGALYRLVRHKDRSHIPLSYTLSGEDHLKEIDIAVPKKILEAYRMFEKFAKEVPFRNPFEIAEGVARESGFIASVLKCNESEDVLEKVTALFESLRNRLERHRDSTLADFVRYIELIEEHDLLIKKETRGERKGRVRLMTAHRSKGLEFEYVFIVGASDGHFGNRRSKTNFRIPISKDSSVWGEEDTEGDEDERRLFYVALTRAKNHAIITYARENERGEAKLPTSFIPELGAHPIASIERNQDTETISLLNQLKPKRLVVPPAEDKEYLNKLFLEQGLSVTALDNYLEDPWQYFYQNLLRIPKTPVRHLLYGDAVHESLRYFFEAIKDENPVTHSQLFEYFEKILARKPLPEASFKESLERGKDTLSKYLTQRPHTIPFRTEWKVECLFDVGEGIKIPLRGKLDKVEKMDGGSLRVIDYKTGKPKSRNEIEGKTKTSTGDLKRQLVFYRLLLEESGIQDRFHSGVIDFIEPDQKGQIRPPESFEIEPEEVEELKKTITRVAHEIMSLAFWSNTCNPETCEYCDLVEIIQNTKNA